MYRRFLSSCRRSFSSSSSSHAEGKRSVGKVVKYLVLDGYSEDGRKELMQGGASTAGVLYENMLRNHTPTPCEVDIVYPADDNFSLRIADIEQYDGVAWTGSSLTIYSGECNVNKQIDFCKDVFMAGIPQFGSCWALQVAVVAAGGVCMKNPRGREVGISRKIQLTEAGRSHPMFHGKSTVFDAFTSHFDEATHLPPGGLVLAGNYHTSIQAATINHLNGSFWAVQYHPEYNFYELAMLLRCRKAFMLQNGYFENEEAADRYISTLIKLHEGGGTNQRDEKAAFHLKWQLGIDHDLVDSNVRCLEVSNWITYQVMGTNRTTQN
mmetsp:Transcript_24548/g.39401  ORF Transcript_24548/g.39401 Transcript_24548/m.39401 type:complete len:323 (+) Transcript_24548:138-1106(+)